MKALLKSIGLAGIILLSVSCASTKKAAETSNKKYELEALNTGVQGTYLVKVWTYSKNPMPNFNQVKKDAIHGILFKGFPGKSGIPGQVALVSDPNAETEKADFFKTFFSDGGEYLKYINLVNEGAIAAEDRIKTGKEYKIGIVVSVNVSSLRKYLESMGVIKSLDAGF
ncbi:MAG: hypothetical protein AB7S54_04010 [Bacteroidales bacterium]